MTSLEIKETCLSAEYARELTRKIRVGLEGTYALIIDAFKGRAWSALGYSSWDAYCQGEFGSLALQPPREERHQVVMSMREAGMSTRAIASATSIPQRSVVRQLGTAGESNGSPGTVTGLDGKTYKASSPEPAFEDVPLDDSLLDMDAGDLGIEFKGARPKPRIIEKPAKVIIPGESKPDHQKFAAKLSDVVQVATEALEQAPQQGELFPVEQLLDATRSIVITSSMVAEAALDLDAMDAGDVERVRGNVQDAVDQLNRLLDRLHG